MTTAYAMSTNTSHDDFRPALANDKLQGQFKVVRKGARCFLLTVGSVTQGSKADPGDCWAVPCLTLLRSKSNSNLCIFVLFRQLSTC
jgi:hypothetical protein